jgi:uncharacterized protein
MIGTVLGARDQAVALGLAVAAIAQRLRTGRPWQPAAASLPAALRVHGASFVTLRRDAALLGCVGTLVPRTPLGQDVAHNAAAAAFDDPRLPPVVAADLPAMHVHVSVLDELGPIAATGWSELLLAVRPGDGLLVEAGWRRATLLPAVWADVPDPGAFLAALWRKAGLDPGEWPDETTVSRYGAFEFGGPAVEHLDPVGP